MGKMELIELFSIAGIIIFIGFLSELIFEKTSLPDALWLILLGFFFKTFFGLEQGGILSEIAPLFIAFTLILILFEGAINIDLKQFVKGITGGGSLAVSYFAVCLIFVTMAMAIAGWGIWEGLLLGAIIGGISSDIVIPIMRKIKIDKHVSVLLTLESAISDVLSIVFALTLLNIIVISSFSVDFIIKSIIYSFGIAIFTGVVFGLIWVKVQKIIDRFTKSYMTIIAAVLLLYSFVEYLGSNGAIACLAFGIIIGNSQKIFSFIDKEKEYSLTPSSKFFFSEISFFVKTFFYVYIGTLIDFSMTGLILLGFLIALLLYLVRPLAVKIAAGRERIDAKDKAFMEVLTPKGLAAAVLAQLPAQAGIRYGQEFGTIVLSIIFFSIILTTINVFLVDKTDFRGISRYINLANIKALYRRISHKR